MRKHLVLPALALAGCLSSSEPGLDAWNSGLNVEVALQVPGTDGFQGTGEFGIAFDSTPHWVGARVRITNTTGDTLRGNTGYDCAWWFRAYDNADRGGEPVWRQETAKEPRVCYDRLLRLSVAPGETFEFYPNYVASLAELRAVASGRPLYFGAALRFDLENGQHSWTNEFPAGSLTP
jgi:hypothetical protein